MSTVSDHHQYLFLGKITNSLSAEEELELQELFAHDDQAQEAFITLVNQLPPQQVSQSFNHLNEPGFWKNISGEIHDQQRLVRQRKVIRSISAFAVIGIIATSGWLFMKQSNNHKLPAGQVIAQTTNRSVELQLADGARIDLSTTKGNLQKGQLMLDNTNNTLSYQAMSESAVGVNTVRVPVAMDYKIRLSDGSEIWLNSTSSLSFPSKFEKNKREVTISGEAYCKIAKQTNQPFIVHLADDTVTVTGTEFNVNTYNAHTTKVALVNGIVHFASGHSKVKIEPGIQAVAENGHIAQAPFPAEKILSWRQGLYMFEAAGLDEISAVLMRWFGIKTQLDDPSLAHKKFTGAIYKNKPVSSFLDNFKVISHIDSYFDEKNVLHFKAVK
jgi:ferric-dicitrate binding protein FerR (iron transport regulator)